MGRERKHNRLAQMFPFSLRDLVLTVGILALTAELCVLLRMVDSSGEFVSLIFVLAVLLISRLTNGYLFGLSASLLGVIGVNWMFTYPFLELNFTIAGYPLTFMTMLTVSIITCTLTTRVKEQEKIRLESEKEKLRSDLLRSVSHDIRTPLTSIMGAASAILDDPGTLEKEEKRKLLLDIREEAQWLIHVVENLLSITRISGGQAEITKREEAAEEVLGEAVRKFRKRFPDMAVQVAAPAEFLLVPMDPILIEQVLANLMENAAVHGKTTTLLRVSVSREGDAALFSVADNGCGIPLIQMDTLFDGGQRRQGSPVEDGKRNMGLGLSVCRTIVDAHGGTIEAHNREGGGAEFCFRLPLEKGEES